MRQEERATVAQGRQEKQGLSKIRASSDGEREQKGVKEGKKGGSGAK